MVKKTRRENREVEGQAAEPRSGGERPGVCVDRLTLRWEVKLGTFATVNKEQERRILTAFRSRTFDFLLLGGRLMREQLGRTLDGC